MQENADQNNFKYGHYSRSVYLQNIVKYAKIRALSGHCFPT